MAAGLSIPVYLSIGSSTPTQIGTVSLSADANGTVTLTTLDIAAALRETADAIEAATEEDSDAAP
ncbi:hypothetical protein ACFWN1_14550 [Streptomyces sp. NPDC058459]|uniref:hypothetical protein n=1 Tax=Streptomyces sp. NPDC058459 TaxID=3346508 RepID=UPI0036556045